METAEQGLIAQPMAETMPADLAGAIGARYAGSPSLTGECGFTAIYEKEAGQRAKLPYLIFTIRSGTPLITTDTDYWYTSRVVFDARAETQEQANALREMVAAKFGSGPYDFATGFSIPFFQGNVAEGKEPSRAVVGGYVFKATIEYDARCLRY